MKVDIAMFGQKADGKETPAVPDVIYRLTQWGIQTIAVTMRTFGIAEMRLELAPSGALPVATAKFKPMEDVQIPEELLTIRVEIIRGVLKTFMERLGVGMIKLGLAGPELAELKAYWEYLKTGVKPAGGATADAGIIFENVPLPVETDPGAKAATRPPTKRRKPVAKKRGK